MSIITNENRGQILGGGKAPDESPSVSSAQAAVEIAGPVSSLGVGGGCLSARDCQSLLRRWTARAEMFRGAWKICRFRDGGPDHAGMLKYDYAATALEAAIREMREQMEAATVRQPTDNAEVCQPHREPTQPKE